MEIGKEELKALEQAYATHPLGALGYWQRWQNTVIKSLPNFAADYVYLAQTYDLSAYERAAERVRKQLGHQCPATGFRDAEHGAMVVETKALGPVTRSFLDSEIELEFLGKYVDLDNLSTALDIGAGYGRFAVALACSAPEATIHCVDAVPISTILQRQYTRDRDRIRVHTLDFMDTQPRVDLAINIHSWSECGIEQVERWLKYIRCEYLFTAANTPGYETWGGGTWKGESFKPLLESRYDLLGEESGIGVDENSTYAAWRAHADRHP